MILIGLPVILLFVISLGGFLGSETLKCAYNKRYARGYAQSYFYTAAVCFFCAIFVVLLSGFRVERSLYSILLGLLFGVAVMGNIAASAMAIRIGPWSYTTVMVSLGIVIPAFSGAIFFGEPLSWLDFLGLALMIVCFVCSVKHEEGEQKSSMRWLIFSVIAMLSISVVGVLQKTHQSSPHKGEVTAFLLVAFLSAALLSLVFYLMLRSRIPISEREHGGNRLRPLWILIAAGGATALNHTINLYLSGALESVVFFPVMCGFELIGVTLSSVLLFKERLSRSQWIGLACGAVAALLLCM